MPHIRTTAVWRTARLLSLVILPLSVTSGVASAQWMDKLKGILGEDETTDQSLSAEEIGGGLREALRVGTGNVVAALGVPDGFNLDPEVHIPLPAQLDQVKDVLDKVGMGSMLNDLELRLNRAAEIATPKARSLFLDAIDDMTLNDVMGIYNGPEDAATRYFRSSMSEPLSAEMKPVVEASLADAGAVKAYDAVMERYRAVPFAPEVSADLNDYVVRQGMDGIFFYLAREEAAIRENPAKRTTDLLKRVFGR